MKRPIVILITLAIVVIIGGFVFLNQNGGPSTAPTGWKTYASSTSAFSFQYPETIDTDFISSVVWPPRVRVFDGSFKCTEGGNEIEVNGKTTKVTLGDRTYCVAKKSEGAAGSTYTEYAYAYMQDDKTIIITFDLRLVQCSNFDEAQQSACEKERASFDMNSLIDTVARTITLAQ